MYISLVSISVIYLSLSRLAKYVVRIQKKIILITSFHADLTNTDADTDDVQTSQRIDATETVTQGTSTVLSFFITRVE